MKIRKTDQVFVTRWWYGSIAIGGVAGAMVANERLRVALREVEQLVRLVEESASPQSIVSAKGTR